MTTALATPSNYIVVRTDVEQRASYNEYLPELRIDFWYSCAYCTLCEAEAGGVKFSIDHYEPKTSRADLAHTYTNLMYSCEVCNSYKWKRSPPPSARADGFRFFKADVDDASEHFELRGNEIRGKTNTGKLTAEVLDLNREMLLRLRNIRRALHEAVDHVTFGLKALRNIRVDRLPKELKMRFATGVLEVQIDQKRLDAALREACKSDLLDPDSRAEERSKTRRAHLKEWEALYPDPWWPPNEKKA